MQLHSYKDVGHDFLVPDTFEAPSLPEWRLATFSLVLPVPDASGFGDAPFDFGEHGWAYGRDKGVRIVENPAWDPKREVFRKPDVRHNYYGDPIVEGGRPHYNDARSRFMDPIDASVGARSIDVDVVFQEVAFAGVEEFGHEDRTSHRRTPSQTPPRELSLADAGWDPNVTAHHFVFPPERNRTFYELVNYDAQLPWEDQMRGARGSHGTATLRLLSAEIMQFHDLNLNTPSKVTSNFLILNVVAENISSATLGFLSATLRRPRNTSQFYKVDGEYAESPPQLHALTRFVNIAVAKIDEALGRECSMRVSAAGSLVSTAGAPGPAGTFALPAPQRVAMAIPNPARPEDSDRFTLSEANNGSVPDDIEGPLVLQTRNTKWKWHEQWAWQILEGADSYPELVPYQTQDALQELVAAQLSSWTIMTSDEGVGMVRTKSASREGMRYWSMANTRFVDVVMLQMRAQAGENHLRKTLQIVGEKSSSIGEASHAELRADLERMERLQLDHIEIRDKLWFRTIPGRDIDTRVLKGLQRATGFNQLREDFDSKMKSRQQVMRNQFEQLSGEIAEEESKRAEAMNLVLGFVAAAIGAPDWADAAGVTTLGGMLGLGLIIFVAMFAVVWIGRAVFTALRR